MLVGCVLTGGGVVVVVAVVRAGMFPNTNRV